MGSHLNLEVSDVVTAAAEELAAGLHLEDAILEWAGFGALGRGRSSWAVGLSLGQGHQGQS